MKRINNIWKAVAVRMTRNNDVIAITKNGDESGMGFLRLCCL